MNCQIVSVIFIRRNTLKKYCDNSITLVVDLQIVTP